MRRTKMSKYKYAVVKTVKIYIDAEDDNDLLNLYSEGIIDEELCDEVENADYTFYRIDSNGKEQVINFKENKDE